MTKKSKEAYEHVFSFVKNNICNLVPTTFTTDFEKDLRNAIKKVFPETRLKGCWFHFCQAIRRKAMQLQELSVVLKNLRKPKRSLKNYGIGFINMVEGFKICQIGSFTNPIFLRIMEIYFRGFLTILKDNG